ncbi:MAG: hypothetical protein ACLRPC_03185 [Streptococcus sp.]
MATMKLKKTRTLYCLVALILIRIVVFSENEFRNEFIELFKTDMMYKYVWSRIYNKTFILKYDIKFPSKQIGEDTLFNFQVYRHLNTILFIDSTLYNYIAGRRGSALTSFHPRRIEIQLDELQVLQKLLKKFQIEEATLIQEIKTKIIVSATFQISNLNARRKEKIDYCDLLSIIKLFTIFFQETGIKLLGLIRRY